MALANIYKILYMKVINSKIIYNWSNEERDAQAQKRICLHLEEQLADLTSKTRHLGREVPNSKKVF